MKKILLTVSAITMFAFGSLAQKTHVQNNTNTGFTNNCDSSATADFAWGVWGPACSGADNGGGGFNDAPVNQLNIQWGQGGTGKIYVIFTLTTPINLSVTGTDKISATIKNMKPNTDALPVTYKLRLENTDGESVLDENILVAATGDFQTFNLDLAGHVLSGKNLTSIKKIIFLYDGCPSGTVYNGDTNPSVFVIKDFKAGSDVATSVNDELLSRISDLKLYPNPASSSATVELALKSSSKVKVVVSDVFGNAVRTLAEQNTDAYAASFDVAGLSSGIYYVSYQIDGTPVKTEKLVIN